MKENQIGALWYPRTKNPKAPFAKGSITIAGEKIPIVIWKNKWKEPGESTPDFYIEREMPREQGNAGQGSTQGTQDGKSQGKAQSEAARQVSATMNQAPADQFEDEPPF